MAESWGWSFVKTRLGENWDPIEQASKTMLFRLFRIWSRGVAFINLSGVAGWRGMGIGEMGAWVLSVRRLGTRLTMC